MPLFDIYIFGDYSGGGEHHQGQGGIRLWKAVGNNPPTRIPGPNNRNFSRNTLHAQILHELAHATLSGQRAIFGLDFQFAWPTHLRTLAGVAHMAWRQALIALDIGTYGGPSLDRASRFCQLFNTFVQQPVFWCPLIDRAQQWGLTTLPLPIPPVDRYRLTEQHLHQLNWNPAPADAVGGRGMGVVGGQTLCGLHQLANMFNNNDVAWWPFDGLDISNNIYLEKHVGVESYPRIYPAFGWPVNGFAMDATDDRDAWRSCRYVQHADRPGIPARINVPDLTTLMTLPNHQPDQSQIQQEGWILGVV